MGTRSGDLDPGILVHMMRKSGLSPAALDEVVNKRSGMLGLSGVTSEMRELMKAPTPLAFWRRRRGVTQAALAGLAETTQPHIAELESGKRGGSLDVMARIGRALKVPLEALA